MKPHEIDNWFDHHPPKNKRVVKAHEVAREAYKDLAHQIDALLPDSPEKTLAMRGLKSSLALVNEAIALGQIEYDGEIQELKRGLRKIQRDI